MHYFNYKYVINLLLSLTIAHLACSDIYAQNSSKLPTYLFAQDAKVAVLIDFGINPNQSRSKKESFEFVKQSINEDLSQFGVAPDLYVDLVSIFTKGIVQADYDLRKILGDQDINYVMLFNIVEYPVLKKSGSMLADMKNFKKIHLFIFKYLGQSIINMNYESPDIYAAYDEHYASLIDRLSLEIELKNEDYFDKHIEIQNVKIDISKKVEEIIDVKGNDFFPPDIASETLYVVKFGVEGSDYHNTHNELFEKYLAHFYPYKYQMVSPERYQAVRKKEAKYVLRLKTKPISKDYIDHRYDKGDLRRYKQKSVNLFYFYIVDVKSSDTYYAAPKAYTELMKSFKEFVNTAAKLNNSNQGIATNDFDH